MALDCLSRYVPGPSPAVPATVKTQPAEVKDGGQPRLKSNPHKFGVGVGAKGLPRDVCSRPKSNQKRGWREGEREGSAPGGGGASIQQRTIACQPAPETFLYFGAPGTDATAWGGSPIQ